MTTSDGYLVELLATSREVSTIAASLVFLYGCMENDEACAMEMTIPKRAVSWHACYRLLAAYLTHLTLRRNLAVGWLFESLSQHEGPARVQLLNPPHMQL